MVIDAKDIGSMDRAFTEDYSIKSNHPQRDSANMVEELDIALGDLASYLKEKGYGDVTVSMSVTGTLPIDPHTIYITLKFIGEGLATGFGGKLGADIYEWLKAHLKDATLKQQTKPAS